MGADLQAINCKKAGAGNEKAISSKSTEQLLDGVWNLVSDQGPSTDACHVRTASVNEGRR